jgi:hypothetical protein
MPTLGKLLDLFAQPKPLNSVRQSTGWLDWLTGSTGESVNVNATNRLIATTKHRQSSRALIIASNSKTQKPITVACCLLTLFNCGGGGKQKRSKSSCICL